MGGHAPKWTVPNDFTTHPQQFRDLSMLSQKLYVCLYVCLCDRQELGTTSKITVRVRIMHGVDVAWANIHRATQDKLIPKHNGRACAEVDGA